MRAMLKFVFLCVLVMLLLYVWGDMTREKNRHEHEAGVQQCRAQWRACLAKAKTDARVKLCSADLDLCIQNLP
jgi:hypothetical protein